MRNGAGQPPRPCPAKTDLVSVYHEAVDNNADLAAARAQYGAQKEVVPQARAGLLPNLSGRRRRRATCAPQIDHPVS
jgi:outer membrane protein